MSGHIRPRGPEARSVCAQSIEGRVARIVWQSDDEDGPVILRLHDDQAVKTESGSGSIQIGDYLRWLGHYQEVPKYGRQFAAAAQLATPSGDRRGIVKYLAELCPGIGKITARAILAAYDTSAIRVLREQPACVAADRLLTITTAEAASAILRARQSTERVTIALHELLAGRGFGGRAIKAAILTWGDRAADIVGSNPWRLLLESIPGAGWKRVDQLYLDRGGDPAALKRQSIAGWFALRQAATGSTWHPYGLFARGVVEQLAADKCRLEAAAQLAVRAKLIELSPTAIEAGLIADPRAASNERAVAYYLARLMRAGPGAWPMLSYPVVSEHQADSVNGAATSRVLLLTGTPGTGKTYAAAALIRLVARSQGIGSICVMAPTGKAAVRITEAMRKAELPLDATTIHQALRIRKVGYDGDGWSFEAGPSDPLPYDYVVVDEVSMLDVDLAAALFAAIRPGTHVLLVGDPNQLPPVGHGATLRDLIAAGVPRADLTEIHRNSGLITTGCRAIKDGKVPAVCQRLNPDAGDNLRLLACPTEADQLNAVRALIEALRAKPGLDPVWDVAILTPLNDKGRCSRKPLNDYLQQLLNQVRDNDPRAGQDVWRLRDKVICLKNGNYLAQQFLPTLPIHLCSSWTKPSQADGGHQNEYVANGELGRVVAIDQANADVILRYDEPARFIRVRAPKRVQHDDGSDSAREVEFALGYAITGHKSQGSEWPWVLVILDQAADRVASREWIYTAISRGSRACVLIGTEETLRRQLRRAELPGRKTLLRELILEELADAGLA